MHIELIPVIFLIFYLRKFMRENKLYPELDKKVSNALVVAVIIFVMQLTIPWVRIPGMWLSFGVTAVLANIILTRKEFAVAKPVLNTVLPYLAISFLSEAIKLISINLYNDWNRYISSAKGFALLWMFAMWFINNRQQKALDKAKKKNEEIEREARITETLKDALEVQVAERTAALTQQKEELQHALDDLKITQKQLIQAEKMASLGELTAGIAHEIQNPLNFVNNFAEVSNELIDEAQEEFLQNNTEEVRFILQDLKSNLEKINHHGKRADAIVKGMLLHSRSSKGVKESTNINALADEYLRLAYHGLRAKDKSFNATMHTSFDASIGNINIVPQDIGRVILNLITNAFYAASEKQKEGLEGFMPTVNVNTRKAYDKVEISVQDNGNGIPQAIADKIFQPFFTTKPTGEGTGLGLSLSYDIVKAHGGEIKVETKEGVGTTFIIQLPIT